MPSLNFKGKALVQNYHLLVPYHELKPVKAKSLSDKVSLHDNLVIHGDNLKALKGLLPYYHGKVKCIYIDPPYNTGDESWVYNDNVSSPMMQDWLGKLVDREDLTRHDKWLCMMLPRLKLLRDFLTDDGIIFVSIDDNEAHRLRCLMDEIFGEENFVANVVWQKSYTANQTARFISDTHDHVVIFGRNVERLQFGKFRRTVEQEAKFKNPDNDRRGAWKAENLSAGKFYDAGQFPIIGPTGKKFLPPKGRYWRCNQEQYEEWLADKRITFGKNNAGRPMLKKFLKKMKEGLTPSTWWQYDEFGGNKEASIELKEIFEGEAAFNTPKPTKLLRKILELIDSKDAIVLDAFAGSATTGHAVLAQNQADGGNRRFVLIETEEFADSVTAERIRRVIKGVPNAKEETLKRGLSGSFSFIEVGQPMHLETLLKGNKLPSYADLASYVFYTATGEDFDERAVNRKTHFIGESAKYDVYLLYEPDLDYLKTTALTLDMARGFPKGSKKRRLVFAPTKYLDSIHLEENRIDFCQLPFEIYKAAKPQK